MRLPGGRTTESIRSLLRIDFGNMRGSATVAPAQLRPSPNRKRPQVRYRARRLLEREAGRTLAGHHGCRTGTSEPRGPASARSLPHRAGSNDGPAPEMARRSIRYLRLLIYCKSYKDI